MKNKKAAMEMSVGTIVTIVLLMTVLILGLTLVRNIFSGSQEAVTGINQAVNNQIQQLFSDETKKIAILPESREIELSQGDNTKGFALSIRNTDAGSGVFTYEVYASEISQNCDMTIDEANDLIALGRTSPSEGITLASRASLEVPIHVKFEIPDSTPVCYIRYIVDVEKDNEPYVSGVSMDVRIK